jgi:hypothetical protein
MAVGALFGIWAKRVDFNHEFRAGTGRANAVLHKLISCFLLSSGESP